MTKRICLLLCLGVAAAAASGCRARPSTSAPPAKGAPAWTYQSLDTLGNGDTLYGVGIAESHRIRDLSLLRTASVQRARLDLAAQMESMVQAVFKDYSEAAFTTRMAESEAQTLVSNVQKSVVDETLIGSRVREVWVNPETGDWYALVAMGMDDLAARMKQEIAAIERGRLRMEAQEAHEELDRIIERHRQGRR